MCKLSVEMTISYPYAVHTCYTAARTGALLDRTHNLRVTDVDAIHITEACRV